MVEQATRSRLVYPAGASLGITEPGNGRRYLASRCRRDFGGACQATNQAFTVLVALDRNDFGDLAIAVEDDNRFPARRATNELTGPLRNSPNSSTRCMS